MASVPTLLRIAEHAALRTITLSGSVLDLGGTKNGDYRRHLKGDYAVTTLNIDADAHPDIVHDLEKPLPLTDASYDHILLVNVLEHVFDFRQLLQETARVMRPHGTAVIVVPFLFPLHPSPNDYWRLSADALQKEANAAGLVPLHVVPLGTGVFAARYVLLDRLLPYPLRLIAFWIGRPLIYVLDWAFAFVARVFGKKYRVSDYALGYCAQFTKQS